MYDLTDPIIEAIVQARVRMLFNHPFFGNLATRLKLVDASKWCKTAATDGRHLFYNRDFFKKHTADEVVFIIAHEVLHCAFGHMGRRKPSYNPKIWNMACDYVINYTLTKEKIGTMPKCGLYDAKYTDELLAEEIYSLLISSGASEQDTLDQHLEGDETTDGYTFEPGSGHGDSNLDGKAKENPDPGTETGVDYTILPPVYTADQIRELQHEVTAAMINAVQSNTGNAPACIVRLIDEFVSPQLNWKEILEGRIKSLYKSDFCFTKFSRRTLTSECIFPGMKEGERIDIAVSIDTSGSISRDMVREFLSEVKSIMEMFTDFRIDLWCIDAAIYNHIVFTPDNMSEIMEYEPAGGGGNDFPLNWSFMQENSIIPNMFVVFSDGYPCGSWGDPDYCDTVFVIKNNWGQSIVAPFGTTVYMNE